MVLFKITIPVKPNRRKYITNAFSKYLGVMKLFFRESGQGPPLIILHGLFGSSDNWHTVAKTFAATHQVYLVDQRNHGQSPHSDDLNYRLLAGDVHQFVEDHGLKNVAVIGHSMGGKAAMNFAVKYPDQLENWWWSISRPRPTRFIMIASLPE